jgi:predicted transglutaminase-like cysteine proteinase
MRVVERARAMARLMGIALAVGWTGPPFGASAGQPDIVAAPAAHSTGPMGAPLPPTFRSETRAEEPFALPATGAASSYAAKWREITAAIDRDRDILAGCRTGPDDCAPAARRLLAIVDVARGKDGRARLGEINRSVNLAIRYQSDVGQHGAPDAWASPLATLSAERGDCEDYAIVKYFALREAGIAADDLRFVVVRNTRLLQDHAILAARLDGRWLVLDNRTLLLVDDRDIPDYVAVTAFGPESEPFSVAADDREASRAGAPRL